MNQGFLTYCAMNPYLGETYWTLSRKGKLSNLDFDVVALQETRVESGIKKFDDFAIFNSGLKIKQHEFGRKFHVKGEFLKYVKDLKIINETLRWLRLKAKCVCANK